MRLRIGLIGLSQEWSTRHLPALRLLQDRFEVAGVYSSITAIAESAAREFDVSCSDGFRSLIARDDIDAIMLLGSDWFGTAPVLAACDYGKAVYCGSDVSFQPSVAAALKKRVDEAGIAFVAEFPRRYAPASLRLKELIATRLGKPQLLFCHRRLTEERPIKPGHEPTQGMLERELVELIDWCSFIVGRKPQAVQAVGHTAEQGGAKDYQALSLDYSASVAERNSIVAQISCGTYIPNSWNEAIAFRPPAAIQVCCENGLAFIDLPSTLVWFDEAGRHQESLEAEMSVGQQLLTQFHRAVTSLVRKMGDLDDVYCSRQTLQEAQRSIVEGQLIRLNQS